MILFIPIKGVPEPEWSKPENYRQSEPLWNADVDDVSLPGWFSIIGSLAWTFTKLMLGLSIPFYIMTLF